MRKLCFLERLVNILADMDEAGKVGCLMMVGSASGLIAVAILIIIWTIY